MAQQRVRGSVRVASGAPVILSVPFGGGQISRYEGLLDNVSTSGLKVILRDNSVGPISPGARARILIEKKGMDSRLELAGAVVSTNEADGRFNIHLRFDRPYYDAVRNVTGYQRVLVELNPYGWTDYRVQAGIETK